MKEFLEPYQIFDDPIKYYNAMLEDIEKAKEYILLETYRVGNDTIGIKFRDALTEKTKEGVKVRVLIDSWGGKSLSDHFFDELIQYGGQVRYFEKVKFDFDFFTKGHRRNHRKLLIIDDDISYVGSTNITEYNMNWREMVLRLKGDIAETFKKLFNQDFKIYNKYIYNKANNSRTVNHSSCQILRDVPSITSQKVMKKFVQLIKNAKKQVLIETPYFLPGFILRKTMIEAARRGVDVTVILPKNSDVGVVDILRNKYLGPLYENMVKFLFYTPHNLHAKAMLIDDETYAIGSSNFDYRSFRYMYEILLVGKDKRIIQQVDDHFRHTMMHCEGFDYERWLNRPVINKFFEWVLLPFRHLL